MSDLRELYQELILDHHRNPRNFRRLPNANRSAEGFNPLCGDRIHLDLRVENGSIAEAGFQGAGCAISQASASLMSEALQGKTEPEAKKLFESFHRIVTGKSAAAADLGKLAAFAGVAEFPVRVKCALLSWRTLEAALQNRKDTVTTE